MRFVSRQVINCEPMNIVVVEDHIDLRNSFVEHLAHDGYTIWGATCGEDLDQLMAEHVVNLLILDVNLPGENGFQIAQRVRAAYANIHIIMLTVKGGEPDRIKGYESGADMYMAKPVSPAELSAVVRSVYRRLQSEHVEDVVLELDIQHMKLTGPAGQVSLSKRDIAFIRALAVAPDRRLPYWRLFEATNRSLDDEHSKSQLELQIFRLRKKFTELGLDEHFIKSIRGIGYQLTESVRVID